MCPCCRKEAFVSFWPASDDSAHQAGKAIIDQQFGGMEVRFRAKRTQQQVAMTLAQQLGIVGLWFVQGEMDLRGLEQDFPFI
jgi:hypothetical protein